MRILGVIFLLLLVTVVMPGLFKNLPFVCLAFLGSALIVMLRREWA